MKRFSLLCLDRMLPTPQRSPRLKLFDILQHYHAWTYQTCPAAGNPRQTANKLVVWLPALCFAEMLTIWRKPRQRHRMPATYFDRIYLPHILAVMLRVRVICLMHLDRLWIMIDRDIYTVPCRFFDAGACPAAPSKVIYYQFSVNHRCSVSSLHKIRHTHLNRLIFLFYRPLLSDFFQLFQTFRLQPFVSSHLVYGL